MKQFFVLAILIGAVCVLGRSALAQETKADVAQTAEAAYLQGLSLMDSDPSKTNILVRRIIKAFDKSTYIGYTATPYANVLIDESPNFALK